ncbi:glutamyl-tRNA reductase [Psychrobacter sanguinis]|uniref:glutamyl-tRNA reductase n=1 Tax=Psychrobacter sanguinis TaxID=861445 RepID=UPI00020C93E6|nr:glutamyl-tRNA reductase [Psychrobacter sanguinis]EGK14059.1 glutamyl-tRNA reductase [Psychrobacter sp. 1501(2011)]MCD9150603.1 glutamyl-tRNA reductase [Psychrobacter sanguinis]
MNLVVIGVNHKTAPVALRERLAFVGGDIQVAQAELQKITAGSLIISTCNRTEIYALAPNTQALIDQVPSLSSSALASEAHAATPVTTSQLTEQLVSWLAEFKHLPIAEVRPYLYDYIDSQALTHLLRVAAGLDSMILGEPQIFGQIKRSVADAKQYGYLTNQLNWVVEQIFAGAKRVRNETDVGTQAISLGYAASKLVTQIFDKPEEATFLLVAAGEMNRLVAQHIAALGVKKILICNRTPQRAQELAQELQRPGLQIEVHALSELNNLLYQADIVSSCSGSMDMLIDQHMTRRALKKRRYKPMLMVDLAVPRDIDSSVGKIDDVYLYSVDDLQHVIAGNLEKRRQAAVEAELLVSQLVVEIERRFQVRKVGQDIYEYRYSAEQKADAILQDMLHQLATTDTSPEQMMTELTRRLTQTLSHAPSSLMRRAAHDGNSEVLNVIITGLKDAYRKK